jgi:hypothetical protein
MQGAASRARAIDIWPSSVAPSAGDGKCVVCDSLVRPATLVRVCDECNYGSYAGRCVVCGGIGVSDAYYCKECTIQEKDVSAGQDDARRCRRQCRSRARLGPIVC